MIEQFEKGEITEEQMRAFQREILYTENAMKGYERAVEQAARQLDQAKVKQGAAADSLGTLRAKVQLQEKELDSLKEKYKAAVIAEGENSASARELAKQIGTLSGELKEDSKRLEDADKAADAFDETLDETAEDSSKAAKKVDGLGSAAKGTGTELSTAAVALGTFMGNLTLDVLEAAADKIAEIGKGALETGMSFEAAMSQIAATQGLSVSDIQNDVGGAAYTMDLLTDKARAMGAATSFSAAEAADGLNVLLMSGYDAATSVEMIENVLHEAEAGGISIAEAASYISGSMKGFTRESERFGDSASASAYYADLIAKGATLAATDVPQLGQALSDVAATANTYGQSAGSVTLSLLRLAEQGETGSGAATALAAAMKNLYAPTDTAKKALDQIGVSAYDASGEARDFNTVVGELDTALSALTGEERANLENAIFGIQGQAAFDKMVVTSGDKLQSFYEGIASAAGSSALQSETMLDNMKGDLTKLYSAWSDLEISIYNGVNTPIRHVVQGITDDLLPAVNALVQGADGAEEQVGEAFGGLASMVLSELTGMLPSAAKVIGRLGLTLVQQIPTLLQGVGEAAVLIIDELAAVLPDTLPVLAEAFETLLPLVIGLMTDGIPRIISLIGALVAQGAPALIQGAELLLGSLLDVMPQMLRSILPVVLDLLTEDIPQLVTMAALLLEQGAPAILQAGILMLGALLEALPQVIRSLTQQLPALIEVILGNMTSAHPELLTAAFQMFTMIVEALPDIVSALADALPVIIDTILDVLLSADSMNSMAEAGFKLLTALLLALPDIIVQLIAAAALVIEHILTAIAERYPEMQEKGKELFQSLIAKGPEIVQNLKDFGMRLIHALIDAIRSRFGDLSQSGVAMFDAIISAFSQRLSAIRDAGRELVRGLWDGIQGMKDWVLGKIGGFCNAILDGILETFDIHSPSRKTAYVGRMLDAGLAEGVEQDAEAPEQALHHMAADLLEEAYRIPAQAMSAYAGQMLDAGLADDTAQDAETPEQALRRMAADLLEEAYRIPAQVMSAYAGQMLDAGLADDTAQDAEAPEQTLRRIAADLLEEAYRIPAQVMSAYAGQMLDAGLADDTEQDAEAPNQAMRRMAAELLGETYRIPVQAMTAAQGQTPPPQALSDDGALMSRLDRILSAIERGQVLLLDGKALVGGTIAEINTQLGQIQVLTARSDL